MAERLLWDEDFAYETSDQDELDGLFEEDGGLTAEGHDLLYQMEQNGEFV